jgi:hypothetical protein
MKRLIFRGDHTVPFELFIWDTTNSDGSISIPLTPQQVIHLLAKASAGYASWADAQQEAALAPSTEYRRATPS